jgi:L-fuconolactonase
MRLDSHQHFWHYSAADYPWMTEPLRALRRDYLPADLQPLLAHAKLDGCVAVQARQSLAETRWLLQLAEQHHFIKGVVGWVDLCSASVDEQIAEFCKQPRFVGVRHVVQDEPDDRFLLRPDFQRGLARLSAYDLTYDILIYPRQLAAALELVRCFPAQPFVLDHLAKPEICRGVLSPWREQVRELAQSPHVCCKVSGLVTEAKWQQWRQDDFRPYLDVVFEAFGPERLLFGSDWPVCTLAGSYEQVFALVDEYTSPLSSTQREGFFGGNAARFYGIETEGEAHAS